jgi:predicted nucleic acid-binding Zn ribbon protein
MERASKLIRQLSLPGGAISPEELACAAWPQAVGKKIAAHTRAAKLVRTRLVVEVEDAVWQRQLFQLEPLIVRSLAKILAAGLVEELHFQIVPRRREPQRAAHASPRAAGLFADEADAIEDPVMRRLFVLSRNRAGA